MDIARELCTAVNSGFPNWTTAATEAKLKEPYLAYEANAKRAPITDERKMLIVEFFIGKTWYDKFSSAVNSTDCVASSRLYEILNDWQMYAGGNKNDYKTDYILYIFCLLKRPFLAVVSHLVRSYR